MVPVSGTNDIEVAFGGGAVLRIKGEYFLV